MTVRFLVLAIAGLSACTSHEQLCFSEATQRYVATQALIAQAEEAAEKGYKERPEWLQFTDVSECGPTLEERALCTTQYGVVFDSYTASDPEAEAAQAKELSARLPRLRIEAEQAYQACLASGRAR